LTTKMYMIMAIF